MFTCEWTHEPAVKNSAALFSLSFIGISHTFFFLDIGGDSSQHNAPLNIGLRTPIIASFIGSPKWLRFLLFQHEPQPCLCISAWFSDPVYFAEKKKCCPSPSQCPPISSLCSYLDFVLWQTRHSIAFVHCVPLLLSMASWTHFPFRDPHPRQPPLLFDLYA